MGWRAVSNGTKRVKAAKTGDNACFGTFFTIICLLRRQAHYLYIIFHTAP
jgi:hypothetical protein